MGRSLRVALPGVVVGLLLFSPLALGAASSSSPQDDGIFGTNAAPPAQTDAVLPSDFQESTVFSGLTNPTVIRFAPDGRIFVAEKRGVIKAFDNLSDPTPTVVADLNVNTYNFWDRGLLGMAVDPNFPTNPYVYVLYTYDADIGGTAPKYGTAGVYDDPCPDGATTAGCRVSARLSRITYPSGVEQPLINSDWCQQFPSHSIGALNFGPDGALYISGGDGASFNQVDYGQLGGNLCTDPANEGGAIRSQDLRTTSDPTSLDGAILRVDPATGAALPNNPNSGSSDANARRIIAHGLRNPFRFTFRPGTSELWIGDVGWNTWEEINRITNPTDSTVENFGWPCYEGDNSSSARQSGYDGANIPICESLYTSGPVVAPYYAYNHGALVVPGESCPSGGSSISGMAFYTGGSYPAVYNGALFFADHTRNCIWAMFPDQNGLPLKNNIATFAASAAGPVDLEIGPGGDLFYVGYDDGTIRRIQYTGPPPPPPPPGSLVAAYSFDENGGSTVADASGNGNNGTIGTATWSTGKYGSALSFNGTTARVTIPDASSLRLTDAMTVEAWVNPTTVNAAWRDVIYKGDDNYYLSATSGSGSGVPAVGAIFNGGYGEAYGQNTLGPNAWSHIAATYDASTLRLYVNGVQVASKSQSGTIATSANPLQLGGDSFYGQYFSGKIDDVRIYNTARTAAQIQTDMNTPVGSAPGDTQPPSNPSGLGATAVSQTQINLSWTASMDNVGVTAYHVERCQGASCTDFVEVGTTAGNVTTFSNTTGLAAGTTYRYQVRAQDAVPNFSGYSNIASATTLGTPNTPPTASIDTPTAGTKWNVGQTISFTGSATDTQDGNLPPSALSWSLVVQHCWQYDPTNCHSHSAGAWTGTAGNSFIAPDHEWPAYLELTLTATDSGGMTNSKTLRLDPNTIQLTFQSVPTGVSLTVGSSSSTASFTRTVIVNSKTSISAPSTQTIGGTVHSFVSWSDGGAQAHEVTAGTSDATITANYQAAPDTQPPTAPTSLAGTAISSSQINLSWTAATDNVGVTQYQVERCQGNNCTNFVQIATTSSTTFSDTGLASKTRYRYRVRAADAANNVGPYSNIVGVTTKR